MRINASGSAFLKENLFFPIFDEVKQLLRGVERHGTGADGVAFDVAVSACIGFQSALSCLQALASPRLERRRAAVFQRNDGNLFNQEGFPEIFPGNLKQYIPGRAGQIF